jgi:anthranilate synthase
MFPQLRYARWSLGFVDPPLEISGKGNQCKISALNIRGQVLLEPVMEAMNKLFASGTLSNISREGDVIDIQVAPPADVGTFSEEERSRQVSYMSPSTIRRMFVFLFSLTIS